MSPKTAAQMVQEAKQRVENLSVDQVAGELASGDALLVDIREPGESAQSGAIPGAVAAPREMLEFWADPSSPYHRPEFDPQRRVILHCASGGRSRWRPTPCSRWATPRWPTWTVALRRGPRPGSPLHGQTHSERSAGLRRAFLWAWLNESSTAGAPSGRSTAVLGARPVHAMVHQAQGST